MVRLAARHVWCAAPFFAAGVMKLCGFVFAVRVGENKNGSTSPQAKKCLGLFRRSLCLRGSQSLRAIRKMLTLRLLLGVTLACFFPFMPGGYVSPQGEMFWASLRGAALRVRLVVRVPHHSVSAPRNGRLFFTPWYILLYLLHNW